MFSSKTFGEYGNWKAHAGIWIKILKRILEISLRFCGYRQCWILS